MLRLFNTMTRHKDEFKPIDDMNVGIYTCGPTVYNYAHIGNLRTYIFEDILKRTLAFAGYRVKHVMNVTDVGHLVSDEDVGEDKMELGARREGRTVWQIAQFYLDAFKQDMNHLNLIEPDVWCRATDHIAEQIHMVKLLEEKGFTYALADGVYFDTSKLDNYGRLARLNLEGLQAGSRVEMVEGKRNSTDFALWKFSPSDKQRLMEWDSPWGKGFPGWHVECSAMALKYLGEELDIHCGGIDHIAVHHTNEIAQTESVTGKTWVRWWMHGEFLTMSRDEGDEKMSKSSGEFLRLQTLIDRGYDPLSYRYFCMNAHYRAQLSFSWEGLDAAQQAFDRLRKSVIELRGQTTGPGSAIPEAMKEFRDAVEDDLNMPRALAATWGVLRHSQANDNDRWATLVEMDRVLGFGLHDISPKAVHVDEDLATQVEELIAQRTEARKNKDFATADAIREKLAGMGIAIEDKPGQTTWHKV